MKPSLPSNICCEDIIFCSCRRDGILTVGTGVLYMMLIVFWSLLLKLGVMKKLWFLGSYGFSVTIILGYHNVSIIYKYPKMRTTEPQTQNLLKSNISLRCFAQLLGWKLECIPEFPVCCIAELGLLLSG